MIWAESKMEYKVKSYIEGCFCFFLKAIISTGSRLDRNSGDVLLLTISFSTNQQWKEANEKANTECTVLIQWVGPYFAHRKESLLNCGVHYLSSFLPFTLLSFISLFLSFLSSFLTVYLKYYL